MSSSNIYFDNAATTFVDKSILESFNKAIDLYPGNPSSIHKFGQEASRVIEKSRNLILGSLKLNDYDIVFTSGATEANNLALKGFALAIPFLSFDFMAVAIFQACGLGKLSLKFAIARKVLLEIPAMLLLEKTFGMYGMAYGQLVAEFILAIVSIFVLKKLLK